MMLSSILQGRLKTSVVSNVFVTSIAEGTKGAMEPVFETHTHTPTASRNAPIGCFSLPCSHLTVTEVRRLGVPSSKRCAWPWMRPTGRCFWRTRPARLALVAKALGLLLLVCHNLCYSKGHGSCLEVETAG